MSETDIQLIAASSADFDALIAGGGPNGFMLAPGGVETPDILKMLQGIANSIRTNFDPVAWMIVRDNEVCGLCSLLIPPDTGGRITIGYGVAEQYRGQGICSAAIAQLVDWAKGHASIMVIQAETSTTNLPSQRVLSNNGFVQTGTRTDDEDGSLLCWKLPVSDN
jgi:RimJ/RimL family protein N-acetyltransferase